MTQRNEAPALAAVPPAGRIVRAAQAITHRLRQLIGAQAIPTPCVDPQLVRLSAIERSAEVLRYAVHRAEHWLSPGGTLRAVLRLSIKLALLIGIPVLTVGPVVLLLLEGAAAASASLATVAANLAATSLSLITTVLGFAALTALVRMLLRKK